MLALLVVFPAFLLQRMSLHSAFGIVLQNPETLAWPEWEMSSYSVVLKRASMMKKRGTLVFFTLAGSRRKHLSPLFSAQIRCLYLFRAEEINTEWSIVGQSERKKEEREMVAKKRGGKDKEAAWFSIACVCVHVSRWHLSLCSQDIGRLTSALQ